MTDPDSLAYSIDTSRWPIVKAAATESVRDDAALDRFYVALDAILARGEPFASVLDLRGAYSNAARRSRFAAWQKQNDPEIRRYCRAQAVVAPSAVQRGVVTAALWVKEPVVPVKVFSTEADAMDWVRDVLAKEGLLGA